MLLSYHDVRLYYRCSMLLYLDRYGPEEEKDYHPIIQRGRSSRKKFKLNEEMVKKNVARTRQFMEAGKKTLNQAWIQADHYVAKADRLDKIDVESSFGSYGYVPIFLRNVKHLRKSLQMEGVFTAYVCSLFQDAEIDHYYIYRNQKQEIYHIESQIDELKDDLIIIEQILKKEIEITPNYTRDCRVCEWRNYCKKIVADTSDLTLISGIGKRIKKQLSTHGITTVPELAEIDLTKIPLENVSKEEIKYFSLQAKSIVSKKEIVRGKLSFPDTKYELFIDIEGSSHHNLIWIIGCLVRCKNKLTYKHFLAENPKSEGKMFQSFLEFLSELDGDYTIFHWSLAEPQYFKELAHKYSIKSRELTILFQNSFDLFPVFKDKIVLPIFTYTLKDVANWLGFEWFDPLVDGATSIILFDKWYNRRDRAALDKAISYNSDDCKALLIVKDYLDKKLS